MYGRTSGPLIAPHVDAADLFARVQAAFDDLFALEAVVAASSERALFVARDRILKRRVALRIQLTSDETLRAWFARESELLATLDHPALRTVYTAGTRGPWTYRVSKWIEGESLDQAVGRGPRPIPSIFQLARDLTSLLEYVHSQQVIIRRMVPATVMIEETQRAVVTDLRFASPCLPFVPPQAADPATTAFLAPEVRDGSPGEPGSDIYAAGALLYFAVTGASPALDGRSQPPTALRPTCPRALERVILRALEPVPDRRYLTAAEMSEDLLSDLGEYDVLFPTVPERSITTDARRWEKFLRRALGDDYELLEELGSGGFGRVYKVRDLALEREVALKVLHPHLTADPAVVERFRREARTAAQLVHPHVVNVYEIGGRAGLHWYTMEYVQGRSLDRLVAADGPLSLERVIRMLLEALDALALAHQKRLVHRDLKPENLLIEEATGDVRIADFGLALALAGGDRFGGATSQSGTPAFAAPEQLLGERVDHRADLYSLTLTMYYALTGQVPFGGGTIESVLARQALGQLPDLHRLRPDIPEALIDVLARGAARNPDERFSSAAEYTEAVGAALDRGDDAPRRWWERLLAKS